MSGLMKTSLALTIVGALNWLLVGLFHFNLVGAIFRGDMSILSRIIYVIVGLCGLACLSIFGRDLSARRRTYDRDVLPMDSESRGNDMRRVA